MASGHDIDEKSPLMQSYGVPKDSAFRPTELLLLDDGLQKYQAYSGIALSTFTTLHMFNHIIGAFGDKIDYHRDWMHFFRNYYQNPIVECGLGVSLIVHSYCAMKKKYKKGFSQSFAAKLPLSERLHNAAGTFLAISIVGHIAITRALPLIKLGKEKAALMDITEITYVGNVEGKGMIVYPFLSLLFACGFYHTLYGLNQSNWILRRKRMVSKYNPVWKAIAVVGAIGGVAAMAAVAGKFFNVEISHPEMFKSLFAGN